MRTEVGLQTLAEIEFLVLIAGSTCTDWTAEIGIECFCFYPMYPYVELCFGFKFV